MYGGDEVSAIVLDVGSHTCKGGYAGEDTPKVWRVDKQWALGGVKRKGKGGANGKPYSMFCW
jgi:hypothetical protein